MTDVDVEPTRAIRQAEVGAARTMIERVEARFGLYPERLAADTAYASAEMLGWLVHERGIEPHILVKGDVYFCPAGKMLTCKGTLVNDGATVLYRASKQDCAACKLKPRCCPDMPLRRIPRRRVWSRAAAERDGRIAANRQPSAKQNPMCLVAAGKLS